MTSRGKSHLLDCPAEIRYKMYSHVLAPGMIHIYMRKQDRCVPGPLRVMHLDHRVCLVPFTETEIFESWMHKRGPRTEYNKASGERHVCNDISRVQPSDTRSTITVAKARKLHVRLLCTSRQIYHECALILYQQNVFSSDKLHAFRLFLNGRTAKQTRAIKALHFDLTIRRYMHSVYLENNIVKKKVEGMENLQALHISVHFAFAMKADFKMLDVAGLIPFADVIRLFHLSKRTSRDGSETDTGIVQQATVVLTDQSDAGVLSSSETQSYEEAIEQYWWTSEEKRAQAKRLQHRLLGEPGYGLLSVREKSG